jgi:hypothetical protein
MKAVVALIIAALVLIPAAATAASAAKDPRVPALQREVKALQAQISQNATALNQQMDQSTCKWAYQSHFNFGVLNIFALMLGQPQIDDTTASDNGACARTGIAPPSRFLNTQRSPFQTLVGMLALLTR